MDWSYESQKRITISYEGGTIGSESIIPETFYLTERICTLHQLEFGTCEASELRVTVANDFGRLKGKEITVTITTGGTDTYTLGTFTIISDKTAEHGTFRELVAYDKMYQLSQKDVSAWYNGAFSGGTTLSSLITSLSSAIGVTVPVPSNYGTMTVNKSIDNAAALMATDILSAIGELTGGSYHFGRNGVLSFVDFSNITSRPSYDIGEVIDCSYEEYTCEPVTKVTIQAKDDGEVYGAGSGSNVYRIDGNLLLTEEGLVTTGTTWATKLRQGLATVQYVPFEATVVGNPEVNVGDYVTIPLRDGSTITSIVFERTLSGIQGMRDTFRSDGEETRELETGIMSQVTGITRKTSEVIRDVSGLSSRVSTIEGGNYATRVSALEQNEQQISLKVEESERQIKQITEELDGDITVTELDYAPEFKKTSNDTLDNSVQTTLPAINYTYNIYVTDEDAVLINGDIPFLYKDEYLQKHTRDLVYNTTDNSSYRFTKKDGAFYWAVVSNTDFGVAMEKIAALTVKSDEIDATVKAQKKTIDEQGVQIETNTSNIKQTAHSISLSVENSTGRTSSITIGLKDGDGKTIDSKQGDITISGEVVFKGDLSTKGSTIINGSNITTGELDADKVTVKNLVVDGTNVKMGANTKISWDNVDSKPSDLAHTGDIPTTETITQITNSTIETTTVTAQNLVVKAAKIEGQLTSGQINTTGLIAENISATTITGKTLSTNTIDNGAFKVSAQGAVEASNVAITGGSMVIKSGNTEMFKVTNTGALTSRNATITGGSISIKNGSTETFNVTNKGKATLKDLTVNDGGIEVNNIYGEKVFSLNGHETDIGIVGGHHISVNDDGVEISGGELGEGILSVDLIQEVQEIVFSDGSSMTSSPPDTEWSLVADSSFSTNKTFNCGAYKTMLIEGVASGSSPIQTITVPLFTLSTTSKKYSIFYSGVYLNLTITKYQQSVSISCASNSSGSVKAIYLQR